MTVASVVAEEWATCGAGLGAWLVRLTAGPPTASSLVVGCELAECAAGGVGCGRPTAPAAPKLPLVSSSGLAKHGHGHQFALKPLNFQRILCNKDTAVLSTQTLGNCDHLTQNDILIFL